MSPLKKRPAKKPAPKRSAPRKPAAKRPVKKTRPAPAPAAAAHALAHRIAARLLEKKALDVVVIDVRGMTSYADYFVLASGESDRQVGAMAEHVAVKLKEEDGTRPLGVEGEQTGNWVLLDYGEVVAHLFLAEVRSFYDLEGLWADAPKERVA